MIPKEEMLDNFIYKAARCRFTPEASETTAIAVADAFDRLGLPLPVLDETGPGTEGWLVFINDYGLVLRIETEQRFESRRKFDRINNDPDILQPLVTMPADRFVAELCPGVDFGWGRDVADLRHNLAGRGIKFWDDKTSNIGRIPVHTEEFPSGKPVVVDRLGVRYMRFGNLSLQAWSARMFGAKKSPDIQAEFYAPLRWAFQKAVSTGSTQDVKAAWDIAAAFKAEGKLLSVWDTLDGRTAGKCIPGCGRKYAQHMKAVNFQGVKVA